MAGTNEILLFANDATNILDNAQYLADPQREAGNQPGIARSPLVNKAMRQSSLMAVAVAEIIARVSNKNVVDAGTDAEDITAQLLVALMMAGHTVQGGVANTYTLTLDPAPAAYETGMQISFIVVNANTGPSTINVNGLGPIALEKPAGALVGGELAVGAVVKATKTATAFVIDNINLLNSVNAWNKGQRGVPVVLASGATITPDFNLANNFTLTLGINGTLANPSNQNIGQGGIIVITQDGTGGRTLAFGSNWKFENGSVPSLTTTANAVDVLVYYVESGSRIAARLITDVK